MSAIYPLWDEFYFGCGLAHLDCSGKQICQGIDGNGGRGKLPRWVKVNRRDAGCIPSFDVDWPIANRNGGVQWQVILFD